MRPSWFPLVAVALFAAGCASSDDLQGVEHAWPVALPPGTAWNQSAFLDKLAAVHYDVKGSLDGASIAGKDPAGAQVFVGTLPGVLIVNDTLSYRVVNEIQPRPFTTDNERGQCAAYNASALASLQLFTNATRIQPTGDGLCIGLRAQS